MAWDVIVCGSLHLDIMVDAPHLPRLDETVPGTRWHKLCGGKGGNQAVMAKRAGARCAMIGRVGADEFGTTLLANLKAHEVGTECITTDAAIGSGMSVAIVDSNGDYGAVIVSGANLALSADASVAAWQSLGGAPILILQNEVPEAVNIAMAKAAKDFGSCVVLNAAPARAMAQALLDAVDVLIVNRVEAEMLSGLPVSDPQSAIAALPMLGHGLLDVVVTLGGAGLVSAPRDAAALIIAPVKVTVKSSHGAGDCFVGALAAALARGDDLHQACMIANTLAARHVAGI